MTVKLDRRTVSSEYMMAGSISSNHTSNHPHLVLLVLFVLFSIVICVIYDMRDPGPILEADIAL